MNTAFHEAFAARLLWVDVVVLANIEGCEAQTEAALAAAYDAVHELASNDVLIYRHYGPRAPHILQDVPELADQYNVAHQLCTELYYTNYHNGNIGKLSAGWLPPAAPAAIPYTKWLAAVDAHVAVLMQAPVGKVAEVTHGQAHALMSGWSRGETPAETAEQLKAGYEWEKEIEAEEAYRKECQEIADTYDSIEADLWTGWREEFEEDQNAA